ncbi:MAG TPA: cyclopropane-fatty-acyl-phospholipid synthase family protein [Actinomycetes bacterium]
MSHTIERHQTQATLADPRLWPDIVTVPSGGVRSRVAKALFERVVRRLPVRVLLPDGHVLGAGGLDGPVMDLVRPESFFRRVGAGGLIGFGEAYQAGDWTADDLAGVLTVFARRMASLVPPPLQRLRDLAVQHQPSSEHGTEANARNNISRHYDLSNDLFALFLDESMTYSSALFGGEELGQPLTSGTALLEAQHRKIDRLLDGAGVRAGSRVLEIGTGWGELAIRAARRGATVRSITLSEEQQVLARQRVADAGLSDRVTIDLCDYRAATGVYDAVLSVEMIEAVGYSFWPSYFQVLDRLLAPGGRVGIQAITMPHDRMLASRDTYTWIHKYIFPGGLLPSVRAIRETVAEHTALHVAEMLSFGAHYAQTLQLWRETFDARAAEVDALGFDRTFRRMWRFYLAYSEAGFRSGYLDVQQLILTKGAAV